MVRAIQSLVELLNSFLKYLSGFYLSKISKKDQYVIRKYKESGKVPNAK